ncbi:MAG: hypothetical protein E6G81_11995 [Alphaproteobacteria bacterium]|nr:MAG: hypothetical protein E6G81_11995 [Alphaproteobacteria bacterium]
MPDHAKPMMRWEGRRAESGLAPWCLRAAVLGLAMLLAGCAPEKPAPAPGPFGQYIRSVPRKPAQIRPAAQPKDKPTPGAPEETPPAEVQSEPQPEQTALAVPPPVPASGDLLGLDPQHTTALLGPATQTQNQSPATVWHYKSGRCELDLSFYMEMKSGQMRTLHYDFKGEAASPEQRQACLRSIIEENRKPERS